MSSYWGHFSEAGYLRPARSASPAPQALPLQTFALKAGAGNRSGKVPLACSWFAPCRACAAIPDGSGRRATTRPFTPLSDYLWARAARMLQPGVHQPPACGFGGWLRRDCSAATFCEQRFWYRAALLASRRGTEAAKHRAEEAGGLAFKPASPMKRSAPQAGHFYGTLSGPILYTPVRPVAGLHIL